MRENERTNPIFDLAFVSAIFRAISIALIWAIWLAKPGLSGKPPSKVVHNILSPWLPALQACYPVAISITLIFRYTTHLVNSSCSEGFFTVYCNNQHEMGGMSLTLAAELMFNPIMVAFLLRDTCWQALLFAWLAAVGVLVAFCAEDKSSDAIAATVGYVFFSVLVYWDNERRRRALFAVLNQLKDALEENVRLARESQAQELKAMIGNMAHDLKTVKQESTF